MSGKSAATVQTEKKPSLNADNSSLLLHKFEYENTVGLMRESDEGRRYPSPKESEDLAKNNSAPILHELIQPKLVVGRPNDKYEQEADRVAERVVRMPDPQSSVESPVSRSNFSLGIQKLDRSQGDLLHRQGIDEEEAKKKKKEEEDTAKTVQAKEQVGQTPQVTPRLEARLQANQGKGQSLPEGTRSFMESRFGHDFSQVRVHSDSKAAEMNRELNAQAFTHRHDVFFGAGEYNPESVTGKRLLAHELTHVVQQTEVKNLQPKTSPVFSFNSPSEPAIQRKNDPQTQPSDDSKEAQIQKAPTALPAKADLGIVPAPTNAPSVNVEGKPATEVSPEPITVAKSDQTVPKTTDKPQIPTPPPDGGAPKSSSPKANLGATSANVNAPQLDATTISAAKAPTGTTNQAESAELTKFIQQATEKRDGLFQAAEPKKQQILANAEAQKQSVQQSIEAKVAELEQVYSQMLQQVQQSAQNARTEITSQREVKIEATRNSAQTELGNLQRVVGEKQNVIRQAAENKALAATTEGNQQAQRAIDECNKKAVQARGLGESKAIQYTSYQRAPDIASGARQMANKVAEDITNAGTEIATAVHKDANDLAAKFRQEGEEAAQKFTDLSQASQSKIEKIRDDTIAAINQAATESLSQIDMSARETTAQLESGHVQGTQQIRQLTQQALPAIDQSAQNASQQVDENATKFANGIDSFVAEVSAQLGSYPGDLITENINAAETQLNSTLIQYDSTLEQISTGSQASGQEVGNQGTQQATTLVAQLSAPVQQTGSDFETKVSNIASLTSQKIGDAAAKSVEDLQKVVTDIGGQLQRAVDESISTWDQQLNEGKAQIKQKVDDGLAKQDEAASGLGAKVDKMAEDVEHESSLERGIKAVGSFLGGIWDGFIEILNVLWQVVKVLLIVALVVLAIVIVVGLIILIVGGAEALLAAIVAVVVAIEAVVAFVASIAAILEVIVAIVTIIFAVVALIAFAIAVYQAFFSGKAMTDDHRWRMLGKSFFDLVLALLPLAGSIKTIGRLGRLLTMVEDTGQLLQLLRKVKNVEQLILLLEKVPDAEKLLSLLEKVGDAGKLLSLLEKVGDVGKLLSLLEKVPDAGKLLSLLEKVPDAGELLSLLEKVTDAEKLLSLLEDVGDSKLLARLLSALENSNPGHLSDLLEQSKKFGLSPNDLLEILKEAKKARSIGVPIGIPEELFLQASERARAIASGLPYGDDIVVQGSRVRGYSLDWVNGKLQPVLKRVPPIGPETDLDVAVRVSEEAFNKAINDSFGKANPGSAKARTMQEAIEQGRIFGGDARPPLRQIRKEIARILGIPEDKVQATLVKIGSSFDSTPTIPLKK